MTSSNRSGKWLSCNSLSSLNSGSGYSNTQYAAAEEKFLSRGVFLRNKSIKVAQALCFSGFSMKDLCFVVDFFAFLTLNILEN